MIEIRNPYSNEIVGKIEPATREDIEKTLEAYQKACDEIVRFKKIK